MKVQGSNRTPNRMDLKKAPGHIIFKTPHIQSKLRILREALEKGKLTYKDKLIRIKPDSP